MIKGIFKGATAPVIVAMVLLQSILVITAAGSDPLPPLEGSRSLKSMASNHSYYIGDTIRIDLNISRGSQTILYNFSDTVDILKEGIIELGRDPYAPDDNTSALWKMDRIDNGTVSDLSNNNNTAAVHEAQCARSDHKDALNMSGSKAYVDVTSSDSLNITGTAFSVELWVKISSKTSSKKMTLLCKEASYQIDLQSNREIAWYLTTNSQNWYMVDTNVKLENDVWNYVAFTYDGVKGRTYLNGEERHNLTYQKGDVKPSSHPLGIASARKYISNKWTWTAPLEGMIDEIRISNITRSPEEIGHVYERYLEPDQRTATYKLEAGSMVGTYWFRSMTAGGDQEPIIYIDVKEAILGPPRNVFALSGDNFIHLSWSPPSEIPTLPMLGYRIYRGSNVTDMSLIAELPPNVNDHNDTDVLNGIVYQYSIRSFNVLRDSDDALVSEYPRTIPSPPLNVSCTFADREINLYWEIPTSDGGSPILFHRIHKGDGSGQYNESWDVPPETVEYLDSGLQNGMIYFYTIRSFNEVGGSQLSSVVSAVPLTYPSAPQNVKATPGDREITLRWDPPMKNGGSVIMGFNVYRRQAETEYVKAGFAVGSHFIDGGLENGQRYYYTIKSLNDLGESPPSTEVTSIPVKLPSPPQGLAIIRGLGYLNIAWAPPLDDGGSRLLRYVLEKRTIDPELIESIDIGAEMRSYNDTDIIRGRTYVYAIKTVTTVGGSTAVQAAPVKVYVLPSEPSEVTVIRGDGFIKMEWTKPLDDGEDENVSYRLYRINGGDEYEPLAAFFGDLRSYNDTGLVNGREYRYELSCVNIMGESPLRRQAKGIPGTVPGLVRNIIASHGDGYILLSWQAPSLDGGLGITGYRIYRTENGGFMTLVGEVDDGTFKFNDTYVYAGTEYSYVIKAVNDLGEGPSQRPVNYMVPTLLEPRGSMVPVTISLAVFVIGMMLGTIVMYMMMRRRNSKRPEYVTAPAAELEAAPMPPEGLPGSAFMPAGYLPGDVEGSEPPSYDISLPPEEGAMMDDPIDHSMFDPEESTVEPPVVEPESSLEPPSIEGEIDDLLGQDGEEFSL
ncbi:MAG: fibronectin type III domain-containing protein [Candidatus Thermoplasmatota archaeon]|nr:fibronectin type III domain-containing protein [Candidatus Thermoplasmatota archaeon]